MGKYKTFNINEEVYVRLKRDGVNKIVDEINKIMPLKYRTSHEEFEAKVDKNGYHKFQMWDFMHYFGGLGMGASNYFDPIIKFKKEDLK